MGVCGYTWSEVQHMPIDALARAISARNRFANAILHAFLGPADPQPQPVKKPARKFSLKMFDALFGGSK